MIGGKEGAFNIEVVFLTKRVIQERPFIMSFKKILILFLLFYNFASPCWGKGEKGKLVLFKKIESRKEMYMAGRLCDIYFAIEKDQDKVAMNNMRNRFCVGEYSLVLYGPPGTTVTIYGQYFYGKDRGYFTLTKTDDRKVSIGNFKSFEDQRWMVSMANKKNGGFESYFHAGPGFSRNFSSIKWNEIP